MRFVVYIFLFFIQTVLLFGQEKSYLFFRYNNDSKSYTKDFESKNLQLSLDSLQQTGYYTLTIDSIKNENVYLNKGRLYHTIWIKNNDLFENKNDYFPTNNLDSILTKISNEYTNLGYPFTQIKLVQKGFEQNEQKIELLLNKGNLRTVDGVKLVGYEKLSKGYLRHGLNIKKGEIYNEQKLATISSLMQQTNYITEVQQPKTLFKPDSTILYLYPRKVNSNYFDGVLGFGTDDNGDFKLNGNVQLSLNNVFNGLEEIRLNWIGTANKNTSLNVGVKLPYLFKSAIGSETNFKLFKQDSVFVNLDFSERLFYQLNLNSSIGISGIIQSSNFLLEDDSYLKSSYDDYSKIGVGLSYHYFLKHPFRLMEGKSMLNVLVNSIRKKEKNFSWTEDLENKTVNQVEIGLKTFRLFEITQKHYLKAGAEFKGLLTKDDNFSENELYRIGGFGSFRGFNEESITANMYGFATLDYRFVPSEAFYIGLFADYGFIDNKRANMNTSLLSFGTGISFLTKMGIFNLSYAVGKTDNSSFDFKESKIHFGILSQF
ncbi:membrane protein [Empedobacter brevis NBRC 14943 = ATCC 43319]|uniref:Membrane protein n=1 Tax=Empedobacter brevis NBRC 14943 = ATCC 43319 TaxID=1218108 RepID=A0A511NGU5_9FLAO|nr:POTRA domain-containing protein [Empedobacter brevis]GEM52029.1 membrane protein [Empedobacter brevis NBRC 14943 = ATCC 43319]